MKFFSQFMKAKREKEEESPAARAGETGGQLRIEEQVLEGHDRCWLSANFVGGTVKTKSALMGEFVIGHYRPAPGGAVVSCEYDGEEIGTIVPRGEEYLIYLSRMGVYRRLKRLMEASGGEQPYPAPERLLAARAGGGVLRDAKSGEKLGNYEGDALGAAAAFVCLSYEVHGETAYSAFFRMSNW